MKTRNEKKGLGYRVQGKVYGRHFALALFAFLLLFADVKRAHCGLSHTVFTVVFKGEVTMSGKALFLKDVAKVTPAYAGTLSLGMMPFPGGKRVIAKESIVVLLKKNYGAGIKIVFKGQEKSIVTVEAVPFMRQDAEAFLLQSVADILKKEISDVQLEIVSFPQAVLLPSKNYTLVFPSKKIKLASFLSVPLEIHVGGTLYRRILVGMRLQVYGKVYALNKTLMKGDAFSGDAVTEGIDDLAKLPYDILQDVESIHGMVSKENLAEGSILRKSAFEHPKLVRMGDALEILASVGGVKVSTKGKALQDGKKGDVIRVENVDSKKFVYAEVVSTGQVEVPAKEK